MALHTEEQVKLNIIDLKQRIVDACRRVGRDERDVRLIPVTKEFPPVVIQWAYEAGCQAVGENKVQELVDKSHYIKADGAYEDLQLILIGHLQRNKARFVAPYVAEFHALDSLRLAERLNRFMAEAGRALPVYVQVNTSQEESKYGLAASELMPFLAECVQFEHLKVVGLMTLAINSDDENAVRRCFRELRELRDKAQVLYPYLQRLSMGMSGDFEIAIEEGATDIRVGQMIFGSRDIDNEMDYFWPEEQSSAGV